MKRLLLTGLAALTFVSPTLAQTDRCEADLTRMIDLLEQVQTARAENSLGQASARLDEAQDLMDGYGARCLTGQATDALSLTETAEFVGDYGTVSFKYPTGWTTEIQDAMFALVYEDETLNGVDITSSEPPAMQSGQIALIAGAIQASDMGYFEEGSPTPELIIKEMAEGITSPDGTELVSTEMLMINDRDAAIVTVASEAYALQVVIISLETSTLNDAPAFGIAASLTAPDEYETNRPLLEAFAGTIALDPSTASSGSGTSSSGGTDAVPPSSGG